jgi:hypothetical protein
MVRADELVETGLEEGVMAALKYFSIFRYPLTADEIQKYSSQPCNVSSVLEVLDDLKLRNKVFESDNYYGLHEDICNQVNVRKIANKLALSKIQEAKRIGRLIYIFPFVRFVGISGSLSKGYADEQSDFDFFIVTEFNRLWICRTILHLFKKLTFITGSQDKFCMNYFVDTGKMEIEEKNVFTAIELSTLIRAAGSRVFHYLISENQWVPDFLPNLIFESQDMDDKPGINIFKRVSESILNLFFPARLNAKLMEFTDQRWRKKWLKKNYPEQDYELAFKTTVHISKNHPANFQKKILQHLERINKK